MAHPYAAEVRLLCEKLKAAGFVPLYNNNYDEDVTLDGDWEFTVSEILAVDVSHLRLFCPKDEAKFTIMIVLGNEPGIALSDWAAKLESNAWEQLERISREVEKEFYEYA